jgi:hypothetical protein
MDPKLLKEWLSNPKSLSDWGEAFLIFKRCLESLPVSTKAVVTSDMLSAKKKFQRQMLEARTPAQTLFPEADDFKPEDFIEVTELSTPSPFKPSAPAVSRSVKSTEGEKSLARMIQRVETGLESATHNLIQNRTIIKDQDKILRGLESRLDTVQDQLRETPLGLSADYVAPTLNGRVAILSEKVTTLKASAPAISQPQVVKWVEEWWASSSSPMKIAAADDFPRGCETFLTTLVGSIQKQSGEMSKLVARVNSFTVTSTPSAGIAPPAAHSTFTALQQTLGIGGALPSTSIPLTANAASGS